MHIFPIFRTRLAAQGSNSDLFDPDGVSTRVDRRIYSNSGYRTSAKSTNGAMEIYTSMRPLAQLIWTAVFAVFLIASMFDDALNLGLVLIIGMLTWVTFSGLGLLQHRMQVARLQV